MFSRIGKSSFIHGHRLLPNVWLCLFGLALAWPGCASGSCVAQSMQGEWINTEPDGVLRWIEMEFSCCGPRNCAVGQPCIIVCRPEKDSVRVHGPCATGTCDWGSVVPDYVFSDEASGFEVTRLDATFKAGGEIRRLVILTFGTDSLLVHWSIDYPENSSQKDFSLIEYFKHRQCMVLPSGQKVCLDLARRAVDPKDLIERELKAEAARQTITTEKIIMKQDKPKPVDTPAGR
jgi:hypothetical protein